MKLHDLKPAPGSRKARKRVGRGISSGQGKTSGRGQKGQGSRSSVNIPRSFEGGQMPLAQRVPKLRGFHNPFKKDFALVNLGKLNRFEAGSEVDEQVLRETGLASRSRNGVKVLSAGGISVAITLTVTAVSARARTLIEKAGGTVVLLTPTADDASGTGAPVLEVLAPATDEPEASAADDDDADQNTDDKDDEDGSEG